MTVQEAYELLLKRVGLDETNTTFVNQGRLYLNLAAKDLAGLADWWWLYKQGTLTTTHTLTVSGITGTIVAGNTITDGTKTGTVAASYDATNAPTLVYYTNPTYTSGTADFTGALTESGGAVATTVSEKPTSQYQLASDVLMPYSWRDESNNRVLTIASWDEMDRADANQDQESDARWIIPEGIDSSTGYQVVAVFPLHDTSGETFRYRYYAFIADWTSANDSTELARWVPEILQPAIVYAGAALYQQEKGDEDGAEENRKESDRQVDRALRVNSTMFGNRRRRRLGEAATTGFRFYVQEGSLTA